MGDIFAGRSVIAGTESMQRITHAVHIIEQLAQHAAPGLSARQRVVGNQGEAARVRLQADGQPVVARAIVGAKYGEIRDIGLLRGNVACKERREKRVSGLILVARVAVNACLMRPIGAQHPVGIESVLRARGGMQSVGRLVSRIDQRARPAVRRTRNASWITRLRADSRCLVDCLERCHPAVLREIVIKHSDASA